MKRPVLYLILLSLGVISGICSCLVELPFEPTLKVNNLVVNGTISNLKTDQHILLSRTVGVSQPPIPLAGAQVRLVENGSKVYSFLEQSAGDYVLPGDEYDPTMLATYQIKIDLFDGNQYQSDPDIMQVPVKPDSMTWTVGIHPVITSEGLIRNQDVVKVFANTSLPEGRKDLFLKWDLKSYFQFTTMPECNPFKILSYCYYGGNSLQPEEIKIYSNLEAGVTRVQDLDMGFENIFPEYRFVETHYYELYQYRISELAYEYFRKLRLVSEQNGTIFDPIPASVTSNVYNVNNPKEKVLGFFLVSSVEVIRKQLVAADFAGLYPLPDKVNNICGWLKGIPESVYFSACCDCKLPEKRIPKPVWW
ncbi:MAG: DUF4249 domain-containing protein [Saprospiraceae bacterium]|nr:DUF4249 domain-containing protein [Saprospiraceae bacterium]MBK7607337.1 DUF4249 domain-containing protein [Saprospiraceae bacterium]